LHASPTPASATARSEADAGFGVYIHWPFCASKCPYCDFNSHVRAGGIDETRFVGAYLRELEHWSQRLRGRTVSSIFVGGGTPSLMSAASVGTILEAIARSWRLDAAAEITLEANPSSVEAGRFRGYRAAGVNRVSLGVQSLDDADLKSLGRLHNAEEARTAISIARDVFPRFSFDMIYARPGQTPPAWRAELGDALTLGSPHLSLYQLTIEPETPFAVLHARGKLQVTDGEAALALYDITQEMTERAGLSAYEISNHAVPGQECRHNLLYWRYGEYVGIGPGAHGRVVVGNCRYATMTERQPERWFAQVETKGSGLLEEARLSASEQADEALLMGLRLAEGLDLDRLAEIGGVAPSAGTVGELVELGLVERCGRKRLRATSSGRFVLNQLVLRLAAALEPVGQEFN
jgi:oxygen-independent coproporphyrinogen-3 oxidase